jgi:hypothetical protein
MQGTAMETMRNFYGYEMELPKDWQDIDTMINMNVHNVIENVSNGAGTLGRDIENNLHEVLIQTGMHLKGSLPQELSELFSSLKEQLAAQELARRFGTPESLLAWNVGVELASMEVEAQLETRESAEQVQQLIDKTIAEITSALRFFIAERVEVIDNEVALHQKAWESSVETSSNTTGGLDPLLSSLKPKFNEKSEGLKEEKEVLTTLWDQVTSGFDALTQKTKPTISLVAEQEIGPTVLAAAA